VTVRDLFGNMPVRIKQRTVGLTGPSGNWREWEELRRGLTGLLLAWTTSVNVSVIDGASGQKMQMRGAIAVDSSEKLESEIGFLTHMCSLLSQAGFITPAGKTSWISMRASTRKLSILGAISLEPAPTKIVQFISFGINPIFSKDGGNVLYLDINRLFRNSYFGSEDISYDIYDKKKEEVSENLGCRKEIFTKMELKNPRKGIDKCPMFVIKIQTSSLGTSYTGNDVDSLMYGKEGVLDSITELLSEMIVEFLRAHNFLPRSAPPSCFSGHDHQGEEDYLHSKTHADSETVRIGQKSDSHTGFKVGLPLVTQTNSKWTGSPFDSWPRVKQGKRMHAAKESTDSNGRTTRRLKCPVLKCGKVVRQPFDDLPPLTSKSLESRDWSENELTSWTNPITKTRHLVNSRTGFVVPSINLDEQAVCQQSGYMKVVQPRTPPVYEGSKHEKVHLEGNQTPWINEILRNWDNPVFRPIEPEIPQISDLNRICGEVNQTQCGRRQNFALLGIDKTPGELSGGRNGRLSKDTLRQAEIISQVDKKFILTKIWRKSTVSHSCDTADSKEMLVIVDQHAADERCRIEELFKELCTETNVNTLKPDGSLMIPGALTIGLEKPLSFSVSFRETELLQNHMPHFARWGILYDLSKSNDNRGQRQLQEVVVRGLPPGIIERCKIDPKLLIDLLRSEAWKCAGKGVRQDDWLKYSMNQDSETNGERDVKHSWARTIHDCPQGILDLLNSRACRSISLLSYN
jgi:DNA mismatch repair protein MLH3